VRLVEKSPQAFRTISEAATELGEPAHVLRFWESKFSIIKPMRRSGGRRLYRPEDLNLLRSLRRLLHEDGRPIAEIQKLSRRAVIELADQERSVAPAKTAAGPEPGSPTLRAVLARAVEAKARLDRLLGR
jgi:DNA-binding transcriptional MerR regulator